MEDKIEVFADIPFTLERNRLYEALRVQPGSDQAGELEALIAEATETGRPKALYKISYLDEKGVDSVTMDGVTFTSPALRKNLDAVERVFPYIATCGREVDSMGTEKEGIKKKVWIHYIKMTLLEAASRYLTGQIEKRYKPPGLSSMNPGSGDASVWPFEQQKKLFSLFGDVENLIGVRLTELLVLVPEMSVSGILFPTETSFQSCQLCRRERCPGRRAPFDQALWDSINRQ